jgi:hypothetical protein
MVNIMSITKANFNTKLAGTMRSASSVRDNLQELLSYAIGHYGFTGDSVFLTNALKSCIGNRALPTKTMQKYIEKHTDLKFKQRKDGSTGFVKRVKGVPRVAIVPKMKWYEGTSEHQAKPDMDVVAQFKAFATRLHKAKEQGKIKSGQEETAEALDAQIAALLNAILPVEQVKKAV